MPRSWALGWREDHALLLTIVGYLPRLVITANLDLCRPAAAEYSRDGAPMMPRKPAAGPGKPGSSRRLARSIPGRSRGRCRCDPPERKRFGARKFAANFSDSEIEEAVRYAHAHGIRVYVTVNTLVHDRELAGVLDYLAWLWSIGVDAVLVQDTGIAALAREYLPGLTLHASTQMTVHNADGVRRAAEHGFSRVVLVRELSLGEVTRIAEETQ